jgi:hypothetical protein
VVREEAIVTPAEADNGEVALVQIRLTKPGSRAGYLLYCQFDGRGNTLEPRRSGAELTLHRQASAVRRVWEKCINPMDAVKEDPPGPIYQLQLFVESYAPLSAEEEEQARHLFQAAARELRR